jgi:hypothetical protein
MRRNVEYQCEIHDNIFDCPDNLICYNASKDEYGIIVHDGSSSYIIIYHCPWCGKKLPESKRDLFFCTIEALGYKSYDENIPPEFQTDEWWRKRGL